jgi:hybrid cluster-associated redox disulfide protein
VFVVDQPDLRDMTVSEIMREWPRTIGVFLDLHMHCIGCPIGSFHTARDAAIEHGISHELLLAKLGAAIAEDRVRVRVADLRR